MSKKGRRPDFTLRTPFSSHPGYDETYEPYFEQAPRRIRSAAENNYVRNRGTMQLYLNHAHPENEGYESARPAPKARTDHAMNILSKSVSGSSGSLLGMSASYNDEFQEQQYQQQRVRGAPAAEIAEMHRGQMDDVIGNGACFCPAPALSRRPVPRIKPAAIDHAEMHRGGATKLLFHSYGRLELDPQPPPRVKALAEDIAYVGTNGKVGRLFAGDLTPPPKPQPRVRPVAEGNMKKHQGALHMLMQHSGYTPKGYSYYNELSSRSSSSML